MRRAGAARSRAAAIIANSSRAVNRNKGQPPSASKESTNARVEAPQARLQVPPSRPDEHAEQDHERADEPRRSMLGRHSRAVVIGLIVFALTAPTGFLYWGYARHFESSDDAFIAARQFPIAPKVSGYITAVPVTDNQHIASGDVIARIDERDYRIALEQAQAQVANAKANIQNIDAQTNVQQAQIASNQAQVEQAKAALVFAQ